MNLSDMLSYADIGQLSRIAGEYRCECNGHSKNDLIQSILSRMGRTDVVEEQLGEMRLEDVRFLNSLLFEGRQSYSLEDLIARAQQSRFGEEAKREEKPASRANKPRRGGKGKAAPEPESSPRDMIARFKHRGWLFNGLSAANRYLFQVPDDLKLKFREALKRRFIAQLQYTDEPPLYRDEQMMMAEDLLHLLRYVGGHEVQLAADGSMYKRFIAQIEELMAVKEELPAKGAWRFGYGRHFNHYPNRLSLLYDYAVSGGYLEERDGFLTLTPAGRERLIDAAGQEQETAGLYRYWLKLYKTPIPNLLSLVHWLEALAEQWVTVASLKEALLPFVKPYYYDDAAAIMESRMLTMMMHLGLLRIGEHAVFGTVVRTTAIGRAVVAAGHRRH